MIATTKSAQHRVEPTSRRSAARSTRPPALTLAISDHSYSIDDSEWANTLTAVNNATSDTFVALRGAEYTQGAEGHINVYNTVRHPCRIAQQFHAARRARLNAVHAASCATQNEAARPM